MQNRLRIYVAGPYSASTEDGREANTQRAIAAGLTIFQLGHIPYIPHLTHYVDLYAQRAGVPMTWDDYIHMDLAWLDVCDALLYLDSSKGADLELKHAKKSGKQIFYSTDEIDPVSDATPRTRLTAQRR